MRPLELAWQWHRSWSRRMYRAGQPDRTTAAVNRFWRAVASAGLWPSRLATLEVRTPFGGKPVRLPVVITDCDSQRFLVELLGRRASWVANVRASGGYALLHHGEYEAIHLREIPVGQRAPILQRYLQFAPESSRRPSPAELNALAAECFVFRIEPAINRVAASTPSRPATEPQPVHAAREHVTT